MDKTHVWGFPSNGFEGQGDERAGVATQGHQGGAETLEVVGVDRSFVARREYADDAAEAGGLLEEGEEVEDEAEARVVD